MKDLLAKDFLDELILIINTNFKNKSVVKNGIKLLSICSDNISSV